MIILLTQIVVFPWKSKSLQHDWSLPVIKSYGDSTSGTGISINNTTKMIVSSSSITGETTSLDADSTSTFIVSTSSLIGGVSGAGVKKCANSDNGEELTSACLEN